MGKCPGTTPSHSPSAWSGLRGWAGTAPPSPSTVTSVAPGKRARMERLPSGVGCGPSTAKGSLCSPATRAWITLGVRLMDIGTAPATTRLEGADQALHPLVVALERVLAEYGLALRVVELEVDPVHAVVLALEVGLTDELAAKPRPRRLGGHVLGALDQIVARDAVDHVVLDELEVESLVRADVVVLQVHQGDFGIAPRQAMLLHEGLDDALLDHPVHLAVELHGITVQGFDHMCPAGEDVLRHRIGVDALHVAGGVLEVLRLELQRRDGPPILEAHRLPQGGIVADVPDGLHGRLEAVILVEEPVLDHVEEEGGGADLEIGRHLGHVGVAHDDVEPAVLLGVRVGLVTRVDDGARRGRGAGDLLADVLGPLRQAVVKAARGLQHLARPREDLAGDEEGDEPLGQPLEGDVAAHQVVLVAAVGVPRGVRVVLEEKDVPRDAVLAQPLLRLVEEILHDALARLVVDDEVGDVVALGRGVLGMEAGVEVEARSVLQEDVGVARAGDDLLEEIASDVVGRQTSLAVEGAGQTVLVFEAEDAALHVGISLTGAGAEGNYSEAPRAAIPEALRAVRNELVQHFGGDASEFPTLLATIEDGDLEITLRQGLVLGHHERAHPELHSPREIEPFLVVVLEVSANLVGLPAHGRVVLLILDGPVVEDVVDLVLRAVVVAHLHHEHLDLEGLDVLGEDVAEGL